MEIRHQRDVRDVLGDQYRSPERDTKGADARRKRTYAQVFGEMSEDLDSERPDQQRDSTVRGMKRLLIESEDV